MSSELFFPLECLLISFIYINDIPLDGLRVWRPEALNALVSSGVLAISPALLIPISIGSTGAAVAAAAALSSANFAVAR